ncbi:MAG: metal ABC transporter ATP-binding protein [Desulfuromonadales bacterium]|nr:metal ABC transporter ATP-binding protein [Desulfuromonadales bacterium]
MPMILLQAEQLHIAYGSTDILRDISFQVQTGDYLGIVGPNGSGKSTLIRAMLGLVPVTSGTVRLLGQPLSLFNDWQKIGYLPQRLSFANPHFPATVEEIVRLGFIDKNGPKRRIDNREAKQLEEILSRMGIIDLRQQLIGHLSGGQQQRALLARGVVGRPALLLLDDPTNALDPETREDFYDIVKELNREVGTAIILITHDTWNIGQYAKRFVYLDKTVIFDGTFAEFCASAEMTSFFGEHSNKTIYHHHGEHC